MDTLEKIQNQLKSQPHDPVLLKSLSRLLLAAKNFKGAKDGYKMAVLYDPRMESEILLDYEAQIAEDPSAIGLRMSLVEFLLSLGKVDLAVLELEELLEIAPQVSEIYNLLGRIYIKLERIDAAIVLLEKAVRLKVRDVALLELLAAAYLEKGLREKAVGLYEEVLLSDPGDKRILRTLGELYTQLSRFERAADHYQRMFSDDPEVIPEVIGRMEALLKRCKESIYIREVLADVYFRAMRPDDAAKLYREVVILERGRRDEVMMKYRRILKAYPEHFEASLGLAEALSAKGEFSEAVKIYESLLRKKPDSVDLVIEGLGSILETCPEQVFARHILSEAYFLKGMIMEGVEQLSLALGLDAELADTVIKKCRELIKSYSHLLMIEVLLGRAYLAKGEIGEAIKIAEGLNAADKNFALGYVLLGDGQAKMERRDQAEEAYAAALRLDPYNAAIQEKYRAIKAQIIDQEVKAIRGRIMEDEWRLSLHLDLGKLLFLRGKIEEAIQEFQIAARERGRSHFAYNFLGRCFKEEGQFNLAMAQFTKALDSIPPELRDIGKVAQLNLAGVYEAMGLLLKSISVYESVIGEDISFSHLKEKIKHLKASKLSSLRNRRLVCVLNNLEDKKIIALWGQQNRASEAKKAGEVSMSFGQEHNNNGFDLFMKGLYEGAKEEFSLAVQLDEGFAAALNNLGVVYLEEGKVEDARLHLEQAAEKDADPSLSLNNLGVVYLLKKDYEKALEVLEKARALGGTLSALSINLGDAYFCLGRVEEAFHFYKEVNPLDLLYDFVQRRLRFRVAEQGAPHELK